MLNFTNELEQYTTAQRTVKAKQFTEYTSKKQLQNAEMLTGEELEFLTDIKCTFSFAIHEDLRYVAITLYKANADKKYSFLVADMREKAIAEVESIKVAKAEILKLVEADNAAREAMEKDNEEAHNEETAEEHTEEAV